MPSQERSTSFSSSLSSRLGWLLSQEKSASLASFATASICAGVDRPAKREEALSLYQLSDSTTRRFDCYSSRPPPSMEDGSHAIPADPLAILNALLDSTVPLTTPASSPTVPPSRYPDQLADRSTDQPHQPADFSAGHLSLLRVDR